MDRRNLLSLLPAAFLLPSAVAADEDTLKSTGLPFDKMPVKTSKVSQTRALVRGKLPTGEAVEMHQTTLAAGAMPHPLHRHLHSECFLVREGSVEVTIAGNTTRLGPGGFALVSSNDEHGIKNVGDAPATYFVVAIGPGM